MKTVLTPGQDPRMIRVAAALAEDGYVPGRTGEKADLLLCPPGWGEGKLLPALAALKPGGAVAAGRETEALSRAVGEKGARLFPLFSDEAYRAVNARATAEGTLAELMRLSPRTLTEERALLLGFGACGSAIARLLAAVSCPVAVWSHPNSLARAAAEGFAPAREETLSDRTVVINTVPAPDFLCRLAARLAPETLFLQVASGAVPEEEALTARGVRCFCLPGLPGRYAPESEAAAILAFLRRSLS